MSFCGGTGQRATAGFITPGAPTAEGTDLYTLIPDSFLGIGTPFTVPVFIPPGSSPTKKITLIVGALTNPTVGNIPPGNVTVSAGTITISGYTVSTAVLRTREASTVGLGPMFSDPMAPRFASAGYNFDTGFSALTGIDVSGNPAIYSAGFTLFDSVLGSISISSTLTPGELPSLTLPSLLQTEFDSLNTQILALAPGLAGDLTLDLAGNSIDFAFPNSVSSATVSLDNSDQAIVGILNITSVPEPPARALVMSAIVVGFWLIRARGRVL
jgi:hypothetical protein